MALKPKRFFGIEIGGTKLQIVAGNDESKIVERRRFTVEPARGAAGIREQIISGLADLFQQFQPVSAAIGFGGPVDWRTGRICCSHQVAGWSDFDLGAWAQKLFGVPVAVENDANIGALGEALHGAGVGQNPVFYVTLGSGVGGGLAVNDAIFHGAIPGEAEIGHLRLDRSGTTVEERCSGWAVDKKIREVCQKEPQSVLARLIDGKTGAEAKHLEAALREGDPRAREILSAMAEDLAFALSHVTHLFHPEVIVVGGGLSLLGEPLRAAVAGHLERFVMEAFRPGPAVRLAALGEDAVPIGCLLAARQLVKS